MRTYYIIFDSDLQKLISIRPEVISAVEDAKSYHDRTKHKVIIYSAKVCGILEQEEVLV